MIYGVITILLLVSLLLYFRIADRYNIIDKPNERSSHTAITIRGGGVIFPVAVVLWFVFFGFSYPWFTLGLLLISIISFLDDRFTLSTKPRLAVHLLSVALLLYDEGIFSHEFYWWIIGFILIIGWINAFNFMDGINGITAFYTLSVVIPMAVVVERVAFAQPSLVYVTGLAALVFAFFNARKKARTFAGDVGSVSLAFILAFLMLKLIHTTGRWEYILFFAVYGVDAVLTIVHRLMKRDNIFKPHRSHLYQYLANEMKVPHVAVSGLYSFLQLAISLLIIKFMDSDFLSWISAGVLLALSVIYILAKSRILKSTQVAG